MARVVLTADLATSFADGSFSTNRGAAVSASAALATAQALEAAITAAQAAAEANATISGNGTALGLVQAIGTATAAYKTAVGTAKTTSDANDFIIDYNAATVTTMNKMKALIAAALAMLRNRSFS